MAPNEDGSGGDFGDGDLDSVVDFARSLASLRASPEPTGYMAELAGTGFAGTAPSTGAGRPVGFALPAVQLAHALECISSGEAPSLGDLDAARRLVGPALLAITDTARKDAPTADRGGAERRSDTVDPDLEATFVELDLARDAWRALPSGAETWRPRVEVDRYLAAEEAVLSLADARPAVLERQAALLIGMLDEIADQVSPSVAIAVANVALGQSRATGSANTGSA